MYALSVAARFLVKRPMSWVATAIIVLIVVIYLLIISVMEGFKAHYMDKLQAIRAHITVRMGNDPGGIVYPQQWSKALEDLPGVRGVSIGLEIPAIAIFDQSRTVGTMRGIDLDLELEHGRLGELLVPKDLKAFGVHEVQGRPLQGCIVGGSWRKQFGLKRGDPITMLFTATPDPGDPDQESLPVARAFYVAGFYEGANDYLEQGIYLDWEYLARQIRLPGAAKTLALWVEGNPDRPDLNEICAQATQRMREVLDAEAAARPAYAGIFRQYASMLVVETWREKEANFYHAITRENAIMRFIMGVFLLFVIIIVMLILGQLVAEKVRDIGILRAMGATPPGISACFLGQGLIIAAAGLALGLPGGLLFVRNVNEIAAACGVDVFPSENFLVDRIPTHVLPFDVVLIAVLTLSACVLGAAIPAWRAARLNPVECLRHE